MLKVLESKLWTAIPKHRESRSAGLVQIETIIGFAKNSTFDFKLIL